VGVNVGLGEGYVGRFPETCNDPFFSKRKALRTRSGDQARLIANGPILVPAWLFLVYFTSYSDKHITTAENFTMGILNGSFYTSTC